MFINYVYIHVKNYEFKYTYKINSDNEYTMANLVSIAIDSNKQCTIKCL